MNLICRDNKSYDISRLPAVPQILVELLELCHQEDVGFEKFSDIISQDTGLTARILQIANSPAFRQWKNVGDLRRILIVLGMRNLKTIVTTCAIEQFFAQLNNSVNQQIRQIWVRSICCANLCKRLARLLAYQKPGEAFLAGLLYQSGMLILLTNNDDYQQLLQTYYETPQGFSIREKELLGVDHCELGATLAQNWNLDSFIADAIRFQQTRIDELRSAPTLLKILAVAAGLANTKNAAANPAALSRAANLLGLTAETTLECFHEALTVSKSMFAALGISDPETFISDHQESGLLPEDETSGPRLRDAVRRIALTQAAAPEVGEDLLIFARQVRISFSSVFPLKQLLLLRYDDGDSRLIPVNDLELHQLDDLTWKCSDSSSQVVAALMSGAEKTLTSEGATIADHQLLRLLDSSVISLIPLLHRGKKLGVIALGFDNSQSPQSAREKSLLSMFSTEIARRQAALSETLNSSIGMGADEFRQLIHEISNPLSIINNYLYVLGKKLKQEDTAREELHTISEEIDRIGRILLHAGKQTAQSQGSQGVTDINALITELDRILSNSLYSSGRIESELHLDEKLPLLDCSSDKLKQVLINLLKNAVEALESGGMIRISTRDNIFQDQQSYVEIIVRDNGPGIEPTILQNLFSPATSTKEGHSGIGLVVVNTLVKEMGGSISCFSSAASGTEFKILLPRRVT